MCFWNLNISISRQSLLTALGRDHSNVSLFKSPSGRSQDKRYVDPRLLLQMKVGLIWGYRLRIVRCKNDHWEGHLRVTLSQIVLRLKSKEKHSILKIMSEISSNKSELIDSKWTNWKKTNLSPSMVASLSEEELVFYNLNTIKLVFWIMQWTCCFV